jgi:hypothetical protein
MGYGKMHEGRRPWDSLEHLNVSPDDFNELQDQYRSALSERQLLVFPSGRVSETTVFTWQDIFFDYAAGNYIDCGGANNAVWVVNIPFTQGQVITEIGCEVAGEAGAAGGQIRFYESTEGGPTTTSIDITGGEANPYDTAGAVYANAVTYMVDSDHADLPMQCTASNKYLLWFQVPNNVATPKEARIWWYYVKVRG